MQRLKEELNLKEDLQQRFCVVKSLSQLRKLGDKVELCIVQVDLNKDNVDIIEKAKCSHKEIDFWLATNNQSKESILIANKLGIKTIVSSPVSKVLVEEFFYKKYNIHKGKKKNCNKSSQSGIIGANVMIVDDNPMNVELLEEILSDLNLNLTIFLKPKEALLAATNEKFDLFLLDIMMPEMSGFELAKKIKLSTLNNSVPFVFISALSDSYNKIKGFDLGSVAYIEKPFDINVVKSQVLNILKNKKAQDKVLSEQEIMLATVAHDLKTPISAEINALNLLINKYFGDLDEAQQEILGEMLGAKKFMKTLIENVLFKNKLDNNKFQLSMFMGDLRETVESCIEMTKYLVVSKQQKVVLKCNVDNTKIIFDTIEIQRAVNNLIANASEYSHVGGEIVIEIFKSDKRMGVSVQDFGKGIPIEDQKDVFYQYVSYAKKYKKIGTGLGLFITKNIVEKHKGEIFLESKVDFGTKITFFLPT